MKLYHFADPHDSAFARAGRLGTWFPDGLGVCPECGDPRQERVPPLILEWLPDSDQVGDFTWPGLNEDVVVSSRVREAFESRFRGFEFHPIQMYQDPKLKRPEKLTRRAKSRVWLPYEGLPLWDLRSITWCSLDRERSGVRVEKVCSTCGTTIYSVPPFEERHLLVDPSTWAGGDIFKIREYQRWIFCTERVERFIREQGFTNAGFLPDGEIPS